MPVEPLSAAGPPPGPAPVARQPHSRWGVPLLAAAIVAGLVPRVLLILQGKINSDEAIVGLMGMEILKGHHFAFYMGQGYMGSLEAYVAALLFALFKPSAPALKLAPFLFFLAAAWFHHRLAARLFGDLAARLTLVFLFCSSWCFSAWSFAPRGGYMTALALGGAALLLGARMQADGGGVRQNLLMGVLCGLGLWTHFFFVYYILPLGLFIVLPTLRPAGRLRRLASLTAGFLAGALPLIVWNLRHGMESFRLRKFVGRLDVWENLRNLVERQIPYLLGGSRLDERGFFWLPVAWIVMAAWAAAAMWYLCRAGARCARGSADCRASLLLPGVATTAVFLFLGTGFGSMNTQRYLLPVYPVAAIALAVLAADLWRRKAALGAALTLFIVGINLWGAAAFALTKGIPEGQVQKREVAEVLEFCRKEGVRTAWAEHWTCYLLTFLSREELIVADAERERYEPFQRLVAGSSGAALIYDGESPDIATALKTLGLRWVEGRAAHWTVYANPGSDPAIGPIDRRLHTRVSGTEGGAFVPLPEGGVRTAAAQAAGDRAILEIGSVQQVNGIVLSPGEERREHPFQLSVETSLGGTSWEPAATVESVVDGLYWDGGIRRDHSGTAMVRFRPRPAAFVRVTLGEPLKNRRWSLAKADVTVAEEQFTASSDTTTKRGIILFQSRVEGRWQIFSLDLATGKRTRLARSGADDTYPVASPDGAWIVFESTREGSPAIWRMRADGTGAERLSEGGRGCTTPCWGAGGSSILYNCSEGGREEIFALDLAARRERPVTKSFWRSILPDVSPDGKQIAFARNELGWDVYRMNTDGSEVRQLTSKGGNCRPDWSPGGKRIAYVSDVADGKGDIWTMDADGGNPVRVTDGDDSYDYNPAWSPDGRWIVYETTKGSKSGPWSLAVLPASGGTPILLTPAGADDRYPDWTPGGNDR